MTDFRALCEDLVEELEVWIGYGDEADCADAHAVVDRARAALAQPVREGPTDEGLVQLACREKLGRLDSNGEIITRYYYPLNISENVIAFARAVLAKWGSHD